MMLSRTLQIRRLHLTRTLLPALTTSGAFTTTGPAPTTANSRTALTALRHNSSSWKGVESSMSRLGGSWKEPGEKMAWQADQDSDIQRVTTLATIHELTQQQVRTIEKVVPWFLSNLPASYFRQVPKSFQQDHLRAISAVKDANMDMHLNLQSHLPDGRQVFTFIRPGTEPGLLLSMIKELPHAEEDDVPLSRIHVFSTRDETMSLNMFVYGHDDHGNESNVELVGADILSYAQDLQLGRFEGEPEHPVPSSLFERPPLLEFMGKCNDTYIRGAEPRRFLKHMELVHEVAGTEGMAVHIEVSIRGNVERGKEFGGLQRCFTHTTILHVYPCSRLTGSASQGCDEPLLGGHCCGEFVAPECARECFAFALLARVRHCSCAPGCCRRWRER